MLSLAYVVGAGMALGLPAAALAPTPSLDVYRNIPERNLFGLKAAAAPATVEAPAPQLPKVILTGITTILGHKLALVKMQAPTGKPGEQAKEEALMLTEGQRQGALEVLEIDEHAGKVRVNNSGTVTTLDFEKDGPKPAAAPPGVPPAPGIPNAATASATSTAPSSGYNPGQRSLPTRSYRLPTPTGNLSGTAMMQAPTGAVGAIAGAIPSPDALGGAGTSAPPTLPSPVGQLTPEQQQILREIQEQLARDNPSSQAPAAPTPPPPVAQPPNFIPGTPR